MIRNGITHLMVRYDLLNKWIGDNFDNKRIENLRIFFNKYLILLFSNEEYGLFQLKI